MTVLFREWILGITAVSMLSSFAQSLAGEASAGKVIRLISAFALFLAVVLPLKSTDISVFQTSFAEYERSYEREAEHMTASSNELLCGLTKESLEEYVGKLAAARGISCTAEIEVSLSDGYALPISCTVTFEEEISRSEIEALCAEIASALSIEEVNVTGR